MLSFRKETLSGNSGFNRLNASHFLKCQLVIPSAYIHGFHSTPLIIVFHTTFSSNYIPSSAIVKVGNCLGKCPFLSFFFVSHLVVFLRLHPSYLTKSELGEESIILIHCGPSRSKTTQHFSTPESTCDRARETWATRGDRAKFSLTASYFWQVVKFTIDK